MREKQRFSIRKLGMGVGSVLIGLTIFAASGGVADASVKQNNTVDVEAVGSDKPTTEDIVDPTQNTTETLSNEEQIKIEPTQSDTEKIDEQAIQELPKEDVKSTEEVKPE
ncbi:YSIRK-type signal peptide-containing protein, partial [Mammaliicoccus fleurettii]